jgi:hypothetical protein
MWHPACGRVAKLRGGGWTKKRVEELAVAQQVGHPYELLSQQEMAALMVSLSVCTAQRVLGCVGDARDAREREVGLAWTCVCRAHARAESDRLGLLSLEYTHTHTRTWAVCWHVAASARSAAAHAHTHTFSIFLPPPSL